VRTVEAVLSLDQNTSIVAATHEILL